MKKALLTGIAALFLATGTAHTGDDLQKFPRVRILPPVEFDHPFKGTLTIIRYATVEEVHKACDGLKRIACTNTESLKL